VQSGKALTPSANSSLAVREIKKAAAIARRQPDAVADSNKLGTQSGEVRYQCKRFESARQTFARPIVPDKKTDPKLEKYERKRDFNRTREPAPNKHMTAKQPIFVIQMHDASSLHYDFRIEVDGVLKSWAVPKGPSTDPREKRLALPTEDHPMDYADFEGVIPAGEYGAGTVLIWDKGTYENVTEKDGEIIPIADALESGHALIRLHGKKISGGYALQRTGRDDDERWLLVKMKDDGADARRNPVSTEPKSVSSDLTLAQIRERGKN
jgi:DNA ligase D-like protein (predicted 3'-phosphoesterase)